MRRGARGFLRDVLAVISRRTLAFTAPTGADIFDVECPSCGQPAHGRVRDTAPSLDVTLRDHLAWARQVMPDATPDATAAKVAEEAAEFTCEIGLFGHGSPSTAEEAADILISLAFWADRAGVNLTAEVARKAATVRRRRYTPDGLRRIDTDNTGL